MSRVSRIDYRSLPEPLRAVAESLPDLNFVRVMFHARASAGCLFELLASVHAHQRLDQRLRELAILRVATLSGADYIWEQHLDIARQAGVSEEEVRLVASGATYGALGDLEAAVLDYTDEVTCEVRASGKSFAGLRARLTEREIVELTLTIALYGMIARLMRSLDVPLETTRK